MVDPRTGFVYETEDAGNSGFYQVRARIASASPSRAAGSTCSRSEGSQRRPRRALAHRHDVGRAVGAASTIRLAATRVCYAQGAAKGGARFSRLEGAWWGDRHGLLPLDQRRQRRRRTGVRVRPARETLTVIYDAPNADSLDNPDNITVTPRGGLLLCEDAAGNNFTEGERLVGLTLHGEAFTFAHEQHQPDAALQRAVRAGDYRQSEWAGACYSPDGQWLFVNIQTPGVTFAITGPWGHGPL